MISGIRSQIAVKLYGRDIEELRDRGQDIAETAFVPSVFTSAVRAANGRPAPPELG